jgi:release factor glutamine methyltransferase
VLPGNAAIMTVLEVLQSSTAYFKKHAIENPRLNAEHLLAHVLGRKRIELYLEFERELGEAELAPLRELVRRRGQGEPLQHLLGTIEFCGRTFVCDQRALVPRPETEQLIELLIADCRLLIGAGKILDVGTGSGVIAITLALSFPQAEVHASDVSEDALALARENAERLGSLQRIHFVRSNLLDNVDGMFDVIVANLPYISTADRTKLAPEVLHDPTVALFGGERGDESIRQLIEEASGHFRPGGLLALEIGNEQSASLLQLLAEKNYHDIEARKDYSGTPRFLFGRYG